MSEPGNPSEIARATLRLMVQLRVPPNPDNYRRHYLEIAGQSVPICGRMEPAEESALWAGTVASLVKQWEARHLGVTTARKREGLERLLAVPGSNPEKLAHKLGKLIKSWAETPTAAPGEALVDPTPLAAAPTLPVSTQTELPRGPDEDAKLQQGLLRLLRLMIDNAHELVSEDQWISGQLTVLRGILSAPLELKTIADAERRLKEVVFKQGTLKHSLDEAKSSLKQLIGRFIERLGEMSDSTGGYHSRLEGYAGRIKQSDDIGQLNTLLDDLLRDTRSAQLDAARTRDELLATRRQVEAAEQKMKALERELDKVSELTQHDQLTGALNRRGLDEACQRELARSERNGTPLCLGLLDIDNFKVLNDTYGHRAGDDALQHLVGVIDRTKRAGDLLARYGGEEFLLLLPETEQVEALEVMTRLQRDLTKAFFMQGSQRLLITFSAGVAQRQPHETPKDVIERADKALYRAKHAGKNCVFAA